MPLSQLIAICVAIVVVLAIAGWFIYERNRSKHLRERFGPEYERRVAEFGDRRKAEADLAQSEARIRKMPIRALSETDRTRFHDEWRLCQARFVDDPAGAVNDADRILNDIMHARGYSVDDPVNRTTDICAAYPSLASNYREANGVLLLHKRGQASTEDLRKAFIHFRSLFDEILGGYDEELKRAS